MYRFLGKSFEPQNREHMSRIWLNSAINWKPIPLFQPHFHWVVDSFGQRELDVFRNEWEESKSLILIGSCEPESYWLNVGVEVERVTFAQQIGLDRLRTSDFSTLNKCFDAKSCLQVSFGPSALESSRGDKRVEELGSSLLHVRPHKQSNRNPLPIPGCLVRKQRNKHLV